MKIYYEDSQVTLYHGNSLELLPEFTDAQFHAVITDPPYTEDTHKHANRAAHLGKLLAKPMSSQGIDFDSFTSDTQRQVFEHLGRVSKGWVISTLAYSHAFEFEQNPPTGLTMKRIGVWMKTNPMPQITGDRPAQGWEAIAYLHKPGRSTWNGGGSAGNYHSNLATPTGHPTPKPIKMLSDIVLKFTNEGDTILDPFAGGGTTLLAARNHNRQAVGIEIDERYCELIAKRLRQQTFDFGEL